MPFFKTFKNFVFILEKGFFFLYKVIKHYFDQIKLKKKFGIFLLKKWITHLGKSDFLGLGKTLLNLISTLIEDENK